MVLTLSASNGTRARITTQGQITVPKAVRDQLGAKAGDELEFNPTPDGFMIRLRPKRSILDFAGIAGPRADRIPDTAEELDDLLERMGRERAIAKEAKLLRATARPKRRPG